MDIVAADLVGAAHTERGDVSSAFPLHRSQAVGREIIPLRFERKIVVSSADDPVGAAGAQETLAVLGEELVRLAAGQVGEGQQDEEQQRPKAGGCHCYSLERERGKEGSKG